MAAPLIGLWFGFLAFVETYRGLRHQSEPKLPRNARNIALAATAGIVKAAVEAPAAHSLTRWVERNRFGIVFLLPGPLRLIASVLLLDYTLYLWHVLTHRVPFLWRFHKAHHADLDMDASTALRFHFGEMLASVPYRCVHIAVIGVTPRALATWQTLLYLAILFHHSNWRLSPSTDRALGTILVTPRIHGIHHSIAETEVNSNWSSGLTWWDRLHGTYRDDVPNEEITIGVDGLLEPDQVTFGRVLAMPFSSAALLPGETLKQQSPIRQG
jgi:sterol desaturase/sphingolipid hydroxylase (fatty acid hydroxylase superfamily)